MQLAIHITMKIGGKELSSTKHKVSFLNITRREFSSGNMTSLQAGTLEVMRLMSLKQVMLLQLALTPNMAPSIKQEDFG